MRHIDFFTLEHLTNLEEIRRENITNLGAQKVTLIEGRNMDSFVADGSWNEDNTLGVRFIISSQGVSTIFFRDILQTATYTVVHSVMRTAGEEIGLILIHFSPCTSN